MFRHKSDQSKSKRERKGEIKAMTSAMRDENRSDIPADVLGSYTGTPRDGEIPTQDADDL